MSFYTYLSNLSRTSAHLASQSRGTSKKCNRASSDQHRRHCKVFPVVTTSPPCGPTSRTSCRRQINLDRPGMALALPGSILRLAQSPSKASWTACIVRSAMPIFLPMKMGAAPVSVWSRMQQPSLRSETLGHSSSASGPVLEAVDDGTTQLAVRTPQVASVLLAASVTFPEGAGSSREAGIAALACAPSTPSDEQDRQLVHGPVAIALGTPRCGA